MLKKSLRTVLIFFLLFTLILSGCIRKEDPKPKSAKVELVYYRLFDDEDVIRPLIQQYQSKNPNVTIRYRKFVDPVEYENLIINELAEGKGPDIFSAPNYWFLRNSGKLKAMPVTKMSAQQFDQIFVNVASRDLTLTDPADGQRKVFGIPLSVDTLALYYNKAFFEDAIPERGRPAATWEQLKEDVFKLTKKDNSYERFQVAGIAMGRSDNIARALDILYLLMLQFKTTFYNENVSQAIFSRQRALTASGAQINPAAEALKLYTSFALPANKNFSWNEYLVLDPKSPVKEMETFARGKVTMIFGYSYLYEQTKAQIKDLKAKGVQTIDPNDIRVSVVPQVNDPAVSTEKRDAFANYYAETVARTSEHPDQAWDFLIFLSSKQNLQYLNEKTHKPTSRRDMIDDQKKDPIYGVFAEQTGYAESFPIYDAGRYREIFSRAIDAVLKTTPPDDALNVAEAQMNAFLPAIGLIPVAPKKTTNPPAKTPSPGSATQPKTN
jgi:ABC-type glycerol-3-phosphate transport system substrate-binding protein